MTIAPKETVYDNYVFRSRIEARWAAVFNILDVEWSYEPEHYEMGLKHTWDDEDEEELAETLYEAWDEEERNEIRREAWWKKHEKWMYLPDFWLPEFSCWVEIKGKAPTREEEVKARKLAAYTGKPVHILWGNIPDPQAKIWGECSEVYRGNLGIIALLVLECGIKQVEFAFDVARRMRFR
jgi:hypothetical protein